jgi:hypothetical protein
MRTGGRVFQVRTPSFSVLGFEFGELGLAG